VQRRARHGGASAGGRASGATSGEAGLSGSGATNNGVRGPALGKDIFFNLKIHFAECQDLTPSKYF
jgi:hypothetical protein